MKYNFEEGKQRVIDMLEKHIDSFSHELLQDIRYVINEDRDEVIDQIENIIETIRTNTRLVETAIEKVQNSSTVTEILLSMEGTAFEDVEEETVLAELLGLEDITRED